MSDKYEEIKKSLAELHETMKEHIEAGDTATLDMDRLEQDVKAMVDIQVAEAQKEAEDNRPDRPGEFVGPEGFKIPDMGIIKDGKFAGHKLSDVIFAGKFLNRAHSLEPGKVRLPSDALTKLMTATGSGVGDELVPTAMAAELWESLYLQSRVVSTLGMVPMPTDPFDMPGWGTVVFRKATAGEGSAAQDLATVKSTMTATELIAEVNWNYDLDEDAIIAVLPAIRSELSRAGSEYADAFCLNADATSAATGNINLNDDTPPTDSYYLSGGQDGIRHYYLVDRTDQSANISTTLTDALWRAGVAKMGKYGVDPNNVVAFTNVKTYLISLMSLTNVRTLDKYGPQATILTGELAKMDGIPLVISESMPLAGDDGFVVKTAASNDEGQIALVHTPSWRVGFRRQLLIEIDRDIRKRIFIMVVSFRIALAARDNGNSTKRSDDHTAGIHGITYA